MKILHTSDWHLGHVLYEYDRTHEHRSFLDQLVAIAEQERPDALIVCGDVFDRVVPSVEARQLYVNTLLSLRDRCPDMRIVITAGNHDGKSAIEVESLIWDRLNVKVIGQVERLDDGSINADRHIVEIKDCEGHPTGFIIAVPHVYEYSYPQIGEAQTKEERQKAFFQLLLDETARRNPDGLPVVLTAHLSLTGGNFAGHSFAESLGNIETVDQEQLGNGYDYLALGHIHNAKTFTGGAAMARYCGTPIAVSFDEQGSHGVSLVTIEHNADPMVEEIAIHNPRPLLTLPAKPAPFEEALSELEEMPADTHAYIRLHVLLNGPLPPNYVERITQTLKGKQARYCCVKTVLPTISSADEDEPIADTFDADNMPEPIELASHFFRKKFNVPPDEEMLQMLKEAIVRSNQAINS
jgi:exonuclease SbcD